MHVILTAASDRRGQRKQKLEAKQSPPSTWMGTVERGTCTAGAVRGPVVAGCVPGAADAFPGVRSWPAAVPSLAGLLDGLSRPESG